MERFPNVFTPLQIKDLTIPNRIVFPPVLSGYANRDGSVSDRMLAFYESIAASGVGLVIVGATAVARNGVLSLHCARLDSDRYIPGQQELFARIKARGSAAGIQLAHAGRQANNARVGGETLAPSAITCPLNKVTPRAMKVGEIRELKEAFVRATERALQAGADFIEYHGAHGYLINQFFSSFSNKRSDEYGGALDNRARFALNIIRAARKAVGDQPVLGFRISAAEFVEGGLTIEDTRQISRWLVDAGSDFVHVSAGLSATDFEIRHREMQKGTYVRLADAIKKAVDVPVICVGMISSLERAEQILAEGSADLVAICRALIADPELISKTLEGREGEIVECIDCRNCFRTMWADESGDGMECSQNESLP
jgi:2,4-dienoyl-CoA reductase-like NADH-dependent reductase (Old Yellow Enzyme family)